MADLLRGESAHLTYAPPSLEQTRQMCAHLQEQIDMIMGKCGTFEEHFEAHTTELHNVRETLSAQDACDQAIRKRCSELGETLDLTRTELGITGTQVAKLQADMGQAQENLSVSRDMHKLAQVSLEKMGQDLQRTTSMAQTIRNALEREVLLDIRKMQHCLSQHSVDISQLHKDREEHKSMLQAQKDGLRETLAHSEGVSTDLSKTQAHATLTDQRLKEVGRALRETRQALMDTSKAGVRIQEDHDGTKVKVSDMQQGCVGLTHACQDLRGGLDKAMAEIQALKARANSLDATTDACRQDLEAAKSVVRTLSNEKAKADTNHNNMAATLNQAHQQIAELKQDLRHTNSLVLPNLELGSPALRHPGADVRTSTPLRPSSVKKKLTGSIGVHQEGWS